MKVKDIIIENILIILFGVLIFYLDDIEFKDAYNKILVFTFAIVKCLYFVFGGFRKIVRFTKSNITYYKFLIFIGLNISLIIISFSVDYLCLYQIDSHAFTGLPVTMEWYEEGFKFFYFSLLIFSNLGVAKVLPETLAAEGLVMFEAILSFITIIFILSDFISLKESLNEYIEKKSTKNSVNKPKGKKLRPAKYKLMS
jgi:hypothetical protein